MAVKSPCRLITHASPSIFISMLLFQESLRPYKLTQPCKDLGLKCYSMHGNAIPSAQFMAYALQHLKLFKYPHAWNSLPSDIRSCYIVDTFKRHLKTHPFRLPPAPLHLRTLWRYANAFIIIFYPWHQ